MGFLSRPVGLPAGRNRLFSSWTATRLCGWRTMKVLCRKRWPNGSEYLGRRSPESWRRPERPSPALSWKVGPWPSKVDASSFAVGVVDDGAGEAVADRRVGRPDHGDEDV